MRVLLLPIGVRYSRLDLALALDREASVSEVEISNDPGLATGADVALIDGTLRTIPPPVNGDRCTYIVVDEGLAAGQRARLLESGADVVLHGGVSAAEIVAQVRAVARRRGEPARRAEEHDRPAGVVLDAARRQAVVLGRHVPLTVLEGNLLAAFMARPGEVLSNADLMTSVWGSPFGARSTASAYIRRLRLKIEPDPSRPVLIRTVWGGGYVYRPGS